MYRTEVQRCNSAKCRAEVERMRRATELEVEGGLVGLGFDCAPRTRSHEESMTLASEPGTAGMLKPEMQRITGAKKAADPPSGQPQVSLAAGTGAARWGTADTEWRERGWKEIGPGLGRIWGGPGAIGSSAHLGRIGRGVGGEHGRIWAPKMSIGSVQGAGGWGGGSRWMGKREGRRGGEVMNSDSPQVTGEIERNWSECRVVTSSSERRAGWRPRRGGRGGGEEGAQPLRGKQDHTYRRDGTSVPCNEGILSWTQGAELLTGLGWRGVPSSCRTFHRSVPGESVVDMFWDLNGQPFRDGSAMLSLLPTTVPEGASSCSPRHGDGITLKSDPSDKYGVYSTAPTFQIYRVVYERGLPVICACRHAELQANIGGVSPASFLIASSMLIQAHTTLKPTFRIWFRGEARFDGAPVYHGNMGSKYIVVHM
ncbi:hypothetical protein DFH09DRAFT_1103342 [Mycena vulgaris]|nr:hypothetical protein DFH09DRAFT_1103342 [Mycena vulgaris]